MCKAFHLIELSGTINRKQLSGGAIIWRVILPGNYPGDNCPGASSPCGNFPGGNCLWRNYTEGAIVQSRGNFPGAIVQGQLSGGNYPRDNRSRGNCPRTKNICWKF